MSQPIDIKDKANMIADYKTGEYSLHQLADKYKCNYGTVQKYCRGVEKGSLKKEITEILENTERAKMIESLEKQGITDSYVAEKLKSVFESTDNKEVIMAIREYLKIGDKYGEKEKDREAMEGNKPNINVYLPKNERHQ